MKNAFVLCGLFLLGGCVYAGEVDVMENRRAFFDSFQSYAIDVHNTAPKLVKTQDIHEKSFHRNEILTAFRGYSVLSEKILLRNYYVSEKMRAVSDIEMSNVSTPYKFKKNQTMDIVGYAKIDGVRYGILQSNELPNFVVLYNAENGKPYKHTGQIKDGRLILLRQDFILSDPNFRFEPVFITKIEQTKPVKGFDIKYDGVHFDRMWFVYYDYASSTSGGFKEYDFPNKPGLLTIGGVKIRILTADDQRIDYMVLSD